MTKFNFKPVTKENRALVHKWLKKPHVAEWFYGQGLESTIQHLDKFFEGLASAQYWLAYEGSHPFAFLITSYVEKPGAELTRYCCEKGAAITLDMLIGDIEYLGKGLSHILIQEFLASQFSHVAEVLIDPEATNLHAIHIYKKVGFKVIEEFVPSHSPNLHYMMHLSVKNLRS